LQQKIYQTMKSYNFDHVVLFPHEQIGLHSQPTWELSYIITGRGWRTMGTTRERFREGEVVLVPPEMPHQWDFYADYTDADAHIENISITFAGEFLDHCVVTFPELARPFKTIMETSEARLFSGDAALTLTQTLVRMVNQSEAERLVSILQLLLLMASTREQETVGRFDTTTKAADRLKKIKIYISCNLKRDISVDDVARHVGMNRSALCTFFKHQTGLTLVTYLNEYRIEVARYLLARPELSIAEVCYQSGFKDIPYFDRLFKRVTGQTPGEFRKSVTEVTP
jgi:AraC-like DNA-binding protein